MRKKSSTFISGFLAFGIYIALLTLLLFYFNTRDEKKSVHYVKKNEERIQVSLSSPKAQPKKETKKQTKKIVEPKPKPKPEPKPEPKPKPEKIVEKKVIEKKIIKERVVEKPKIVKKIKDVNTTKPEKVNKPKDLFANVSSTIKIEKSKTLIKVIDTPKPKKSVIIKVTDNPSASDMVSDSLKIQKNSNSGIESAYFAMIEEKLKGWPTQSEYAGERAKVSITVQTSGDFTFRVITASGSEAFNVELEAYLRQLQSIGFGSHKGDRAYEVNVEFVATE